MSLVSEINFKIEHYIIILFIFLTKTIDFFEKMRYIINIKYSKININF
nr:MAG TPA: hypothetical protein [Caudoviricetes sp.]